MSANGIAAAQPSPRAASLPEIRALTGLRGLAAGFVLLFHLCHPVPSLAGTLPFWRQFLWHGYLSVDLFFVLSGFVMAPSYGRRFAVQPWHATYRHFLHRRLARIYPLYAAVTLAVALAHMVVPGEAWLPHPIPALVANLALVQNWGVGGGIVVPAWSISTEWAAYLLFPLLAAALLSGGRGKCGLAIAVALCVLAALALPWPHALPRAQGAVGPLDLHDGRDVGGLLRCLADFCLGLAAFRLHRSRPAALRWSALCPLAVACTVCLLTLPGTDLAVVLLAPLVILGVASDEGPVARLLASPPLHRLGLYSYALYLVHASFLRAGAAAADLLASRGMAFAWLAGDALTVVGSLAAAALAYHAIEIPAQAWLNGKSAPSPRRVAAPAAGIAA